MSTDDAQNNKNGTFSNREILRSLNQGDNYLLAVVLVDRDDEKIHYIHKPFTKEPDNEASSVNYKIGDLLKRAIPPEQSKHVCGQTGGNK